jgi:hypothetical protein
MNVNEQGLQRSNLNGVRKNTFEKKSWTWSYDLIHKPMANLAFTIANHETLNAITGWDDVAMNNNN